MSGTSCDGVDAALVRVTGHGPAMRAAFVRLESLPYFARTRTAVGRAREGALAVGDLAALSHAVAFLYGETVKLLLAASGTDARDVTAVAAHGQTLFHAPPLTYQAFDPAVLAAGVGIDVVSDFRRADCAAGGQGAPLVPFGDWVLFRTGTPRVLLNLGGIANLTFLPADGSLADVEGFDAGPANCLSDWLMRQHDPAGTGVDAGGALAMLGRVLDDVADAVLADPFFAAAGPKSTDVPHMVRLFETALRRRPGAALDDCLATANAIAARAIAARLPAGTTELFVAGGGVHNADLVRRIERSCGPVRRTDALGVPSQAREAVAFALLAAAHVDRLPCHMPRVTGATRPVVLGSLTPRPPD